MTVICFDISLSNTGITVFDDVGKVLEITNVDTNKEKTHPLKLKRIEKEVKKLKSKYKPTVIIMEQSFTRFNKSTQAIYKVRGVIELVFWDVEQVAYHATTIRKELLNKGNAKKDEIQKYILDNYLNLEFKDFDQSDSFAVGLCYFKKKGIL